MALKHLTISPIIRTIFRKTNPRKLRAAGIEPVKLKTDFDPFASYRIAKVRGGTIWWCHTTPVDNISYAGHFRDLPQGYVYADAIVFDTSKDFHCCTVGDLDPRDIDNYTKSEETPLELVPPSYKIAVLEADIVSRAKRLQEAPEPSVLLEAYTGEAVYLQWCVDHQIEPEYFEYAWQSAWRLEYPGIEFDDQLLQELRLIKHNGKYYKIKSEYLRRAHCLQRLPKDHPLHRYVGISYSELKEIVKELPQEILECNNLIEEGGLYAVNNAPASFEGKRFRYFIVGRDCLDNELEIRYSPELLRALLALGADSFVFTKSGVMYINKSWVFKGLELSVPLHARDSSSREVILLEKDYTNGIYKPLTSAIKRKYQDVKEYIGYKPCGGGGQTTITVYDTTVPLVEKERRADRIARLGIAPYIQEIEISKWEDCQIQAYVEARRKEDAGEFVRYTRQSPEIVALLDHPDPHGNTLAEMNWLASALNCGYNLSWDTLCEEIMMGGIGEKACGYLFMNKECIKLEDAIYHSSFMYDSKIRRFLFGITDAFLKLGNEKLQQIALSRV